jgi:hypothetical protein
MTKTQNKAAIKALPALRASLLWYKRQAVRDLRNRAECLSPMMRQALESKANKVAKMDLADLRDWYQAERVSEICRARLAELGQVVPGLVRLSVQS